MPIVVCGNCAWFFDNGTRGYCRRFPWSINNPTVGMVLDGSRGCPEWTRRIGDEE